MRYGFSIILLVLIVSSTTITSSVLDPSGDYVLFTVYGDKYVVGLSLSGTGSSSSTVIVGVASGQGNFSLSLQFYSVIGNLSSLLNTSAVRVDSIRASIQKYSRFNMYKLNGTTRIRVDGNPLDILLVFDILVSGNETREKVEVKGAITPISNDVRLSLAAVAVMDEVVERFFNMVAGLSKGLVSVERIDVERVPSSRGVSVRVDTVLDVYRPKEAWNNIITSLTGAPILEYVDLLVDNRVGDYVVGLDAKVEGETLTGNATILFDRSFRELLGLNNSLLASSFTFSYYGSPEKTVFNVSNLTLKPRGELRDSLGETGLLLYRLIGNTSLKVIVVSNNNILDASRVPLEPVKWNKTYIEWNTSQALLYLGEIIVEGEEESFPLLLVLVIIGAGAFLFYAVRRVSGK